MTNDRMTIDRKNERFEQLCAGISALHARKAHDYGDSFGKQWREFGILSAVIRMSDKLNRIRQLAQEAQQVDDESMIDTLLDLASYAIMSVIELENDQENEAQADGSQEECVSAPKTGEWVHAEGEEDLFWCSVCKDRGGTWPGPPPFEYCPHCGAKMKRRTPDDNQ